MKNRTAAEVTSPSEVKKIAAAYQPGEFGYEQVEKKFGLRPANGMTAYRICQKAKRLEMGSDAIPVKHAVPVRHAEPRQQPPPILRPSDRRELREMDDDLPPLRRRRCIIKGCGTWLNSHNEDSDGRCFLCQQRRLQPGQSVPPNLIRSA
jgi:hypothetical protein